MNAPEKAEVLSEGETPVVTGAEQAALPAQEGAAAVTGKKKSKFVSRLKRYRYLYLLMIPGFAWYLCFHIMPLYGIVIAFQDYTVSSTSIWGNEWVGWGNFEILFSSPDFLMVFRNTVWISFWKLVCGFFAPIVLALMINGLTCRPYKKVVQTISYLPNFLSWVIIFALSFILFNDYTGVFHNLFEALGLPYRDPTANVDTIIPFLVLSAVWKGVGMSSIIYLAALSGIDPQLYEAARVDGASKFRQLRSITIPSLLPICAIVLILNAGSLMSGDFEQVLLFQRTNNPLMVEKTEIFETYLYRTGIQNFRYSISAALGLFQSFFGSILILTVNFIAKKLGYDGIW